MPQPPVPPPGAPPLEVLFVNEGLGGHATVHRNLHRALAAGHPDVRARAYDVPRPGPARRLVGASVPGLGRLDLDLQPLRYQLAQSAVAERHLRRTAAEVDVLHVYSQNAALCSVGQLRRVASVVTTDATNELNARNLPYRRPSRFTEAAARPSVAVERRVYDAATLVVAQSEWVAASLRERYGVPEDRLRLVRLGIELPPRLPPAPPPAAGRPAIGFLGSSFARKGGARLLEAYRRHLRDVATLVLVTPDPVPAEPGVTVVRDVRPGDPRLWELLGSCAVFAYPTEIDASPNAVLEAMAAGLPVVGTSVGAVPEMVGGGAGVVLPAGGGDGRVDPLATALLDLLADEPRRRAMGAAARTRVEDRYDARRTTADLVTVLREAAARGPRRAPRGRPRARRRPRRPPT